MVSKCEIDSAPLQLKFVVIKLPRTQLGFRIVYISRRSVNLLSRNQSLGISVD